MSALSFLFVVGGLAALYYGGEWLVHGATALARRLRVSPLVIGMTVVAYGTSAPEIGASLVAAIRGSSGIAVGNVIGSNAANLGLILGLTALVHPFSVRPRLVAREFVWMFAATALLLPLVLLGGISRTAGLGLLALLALFNFFAVRWSRSHDLGDRPASGEGSEPSGPATDDEGAVPPFGRSIPLVLVGLAALAVGAEFLVRGAVEIASGLGASDLVIGFTLVALGTSLPELAASIAAAARGKVGLVAGNVIGSNVFNVLGALGVAAVASPIALDPDLATGTIPGVLLLTGVAGAFLLAGGRLGRTQGVILLVAYAGYVAFVLGPAT